MVPMTCEHSTWNRKARTTLRVCHEINHSVCRYWTGVGTVVAMLMLALPVNAMPPDPAELAGRIDRCLANGWQSAKVNPALKTDDAEFVRRIYLDVVGRIPTSSETLAFLGDAHGQKRRLLVERLVRSGAHGRHMATFWRQIWIPQADTADPRFGHLAEELDAWLTIQLNDGRSYDALVREILSVSADSQRLSPSNNANPRTPTAFLVACAHKPENLAANTARAFLGINLECAQCHNHPFAKWTRDQFWQTAAFFVRPTSVGAAGASRLEIASPHKAGVVMPTLLTEGRIDWPEHIDADIGRQVLARWITSDQSGYFAKNVVNLVWAHFLGNPLVPSLDDPGEDDRHANLELLDELAQAFRSSGFDLRHLSSSILHCSAYQLTSTSAKEAPPRDPRLFAGMPVRGLTGEQLFDSIRIAAGLPLIREDVDSAELVRERQQFIANFRIQQPATAQRSIVQALALMNGRIAAQVCTPETSPTLVSIIDSPLFDAREKIEALIVAALSRKATHDEKESFTKYVERAGGGAAGRRAMANLFWALLNSNEFNTNH